MFDLGNDIDSIGNNVDPKFTDFMHQHKDHSGTIHILVEELQMLKDSNELHEDRILKIRQKLNPAQINAVSEIKYDNEILNHPEIFKKLSEVYGVNKTIDLSSRIDSLLINDSIENDDPNLLIGAFMSLDDNIN